MSSVLTSTAATLLVLTAGHSAAADIVVKNAHVRPIPASLSMTAGYLTIVNAGAKPDTLVSLKCACAADVSAHETEEKGGTSHMRASGPVIIPARGAVTFQPGGRHLMLIGVRGGVQPGQTVKITLRFAHAGAMAIPFLGR